MKIEKIDLDKYVKTGLLFGFENELLLEMIQTLEEKINQIIEALEVLNERK